MQEKTLLQMLAIGGITLWVLIFCSVLSLAVIIERMVFFYNNSRVSRVDFMEKIRTALEKSHFDQALAVCAETPTPFSRVAAAGLNARKFGSAKLTSAMDRQISIEIKLLERLTSVVGTIGSTAVYIGLFGTVMGIIRAFHDISLVGGGGINVVIGGIAEALFSTATGICVAVPAVIAYNYFMRRIETFTVDMELTESEIFDSVKE